MSAGWATGLRGGRRSLGSGGILGAAGRASSRRGAVSLQPLNALQQSGDVGVQIAAGEPPQRHLQVHSRIGGLAHIHQGGSQHLQGSGEPGRGNLRGGGLSALLLGVGEMAQIGAHSAQEGVAENVEQGFADESRLPPRPQCLVHCNERGAVVLASQGCDNGVDRVDPIGDSAGGHDLVESR